MKAKFTKFRPKILTRHPSHDGLRTELPLVPFKSVVRLGSTTRINDTITSESNRIECNTVEAIKNSANKLLMKECFDTAEVKTADWTGESNGDFIKQWANEKYPIVAKHIYGSRGTGNYLIKNSEELNAWLMAKDLTQYIFEKFYNYNREYRLHVTEEGCFYTCRKVLKENTPEDKRWYRNDSNCNWLLEDNDSFDKPANWNVIVTECIKALKATKLDIGCFDVKVQSANDNKGKKRPSPEFIIIESGSAPSFGKLTTEKYLEQIPKVLKKKHDSL